MLSHSLSRELWNSPETPKNGSESEKDILMKCYFNTKLQKPTKYPISTDNGMEVLKKTAAIMKKTQQN